MICGKEIAVGKNHRRYESNGRMFSSYRTMVATRGSKLKAVLKQFLMQSNLNSNLSK